MKKHLSNNKKWVWGATLSVIVIGIIACSSSYTSDPNTTLRNLPESPSFFEKDKTVFGVDANQNGVRDDVEIKLSAMIPLGENGDDTEYIKDLASARAIQNFIVEYEAGRVKTREDALHLRALDSCTGGKLVWKATHDAFNIEDMVFNTKERIAILEKINDLTGMIFGGETDCPTRTQP